MNSSSIGRAARLAISNGCISMDPATVNSRAPAIEGSTNGSAATGVITRSASHAKDAASTSGVAKRRTRAQAANEEKREEAASQPPQHDDATLKQLRKAFQRKYRHVAAVHSQVQPSCLSHDSAASPSFLGFRNLMIIVLGESAVLQRTVLCILMMRRGLYHLRQLWSTMSHTSFLQWPATCAS